MAKCIACGAELTELALFHNMPASAQDFPEEDRLKD